MLVLGSRSVGYWLGIDSLCKARTRTMASRLTPQRRTSDTVSGLPVAGIVRVRVTTGEMGRLDHPLHLTSNSTSRCLLTSVFALLRPPMAISQAIIVFGFAVFASLYCWFLAPVRPELRQAPLLVCYPLVSDYESGGSCNIGSSHIIGIT